MVAIASALTNLLFLSCHHANEASDLSEVISTAETLIGWSHSDLHFT